MVRVTVGMEAIWQEQELVIDEEQAKAELESALEDARATGEDIDEEKLAAQVYEAVKVYHLIKKLRLTTVKTENALELHGLFKSQRREVLPFPANLVNHGVQLWSSSC